MEDRKSQFFNEILPLLHDTMGKDSIPLVLATSGASGNMTATQIQSILQGICGFLNPGGDVELGLFVCGPCSVLKSRSLRSGERHVTCL